jgi:hypothetical protein
MFIPAAASLLITTIRCSIRSSWDERSSNWSTEEMLLVGYFLFGFSKSFATERRKAFERTDCNGPNNAPKFAWLIASAFWPICLSSA